MPAASDFQDIMSAGITHSQHNGIGGSQRSGGGESYFQARLSQSGQDFSASSI